LTGDKKDDEEETVKKGEEEDKKKDDENFEPKSDDDLLDFGDKGDGEDGDGEGGDDDVKKSLPDVEDATVVLEGLLHELKKSNDALAELTKRMDDYEAKQEDISKSVLEVAGGLKAFADTPLPRKSAMSIQKSGVANAPAGAFTHEDWNIAKSVLTAAVKANDISLEKSEMFSSACQKALHGGAMSRDVWNEISALSKKYAGN
jgi:hypothetical protein